MIATLSGTSPGIVLGNVTLPLNFDAFLVFTASRPGVAPFHQTLGVLGATGRAAASFRPTPGLLPPALIGLRMDFGGLLVDLTTASVSGASNPVPVAIRP